MRKVLSILLLLTLVLPVLVACGVEEKADEGESKELPEVTLEADNEYIIISSIDSSGCVYGEGYFEGDVYYNMHTTQKYFEDYGQYRKRAIYFGFYNEDGELVAEDKTYDMCVQTEEYTDEMCTTVCIDSHKPITEVKLLRIVLSN